MQRTPFKTFGKFCAGMATLGLIAALSNAATAHDDHYHEPSVAHYAASDTSFRHGHPIRVFVRLQDDQDAPREYRGNHKKRYNQRGDFRDPRLMQKLDYYLPNYVHFVERPSEADLILRVKQLDYQLDFRVIDVDHKDKKYKKSRRYAPGRCGIHYKAFYTKVKEKGEAYANYHVKTVLKGIDRDQDRFTLRSAEKFSYGKNLRATTNCGIKPSRIMPSSGVAELFAKNNEGYRAHIAHEIKRESIDDLSRQLAHRIQVQANQFYRDLAHQLNEQSHPRRERYGYSGYDIYKHPRG